ncbi:MAG: hypothetical protein WC935_00140 [Thermoleophilia bacterium]
MDNLKAWMLEAADEEPILAVVIGEMGWGDYGSDAVPQYQEQRRGEVLSWDEAAPMIDYEFRSGYGAPRCNAIVAWTASKVISISQYDGSTSVFTLPRNPTAHMPGMPGG